MLAPDLIIAEQANVDPTRTPLSPILVLVTDTAELEALGYDVCVVERTYEEAGFDDEELDLFECERQIAASWEPPSPGCAWKLHDKQADEDGLIAVWYRAKNI